MEIFSKEIEIKNFPKIIWIYPTIAPSLVPVTFVVSTNSSKNIIEYSWNFNDSTPVQNTTINRITHTYNRSGAYYVKIKIKDSEGLNASRTFGILATIPKSQVQSELEKDLKTLEAIKKQINSFDLIVQEELNSALGIEELEENLKFLQREYNFASKEEDYAEIIENLSRMEIPELVAITKKAPFLTFYPMGRQIDLETLKVVGGGLYI